MAEAFIAGAVRTAIGKRNGSLAGVHPKATMAPMNTSKMSPSIPSS